MPGLQLSALPVAEAADLIGVPSPVLLNLDLQVQKYLATQHDLKAVSYTHLRAHETS